MSRFLVAMFVGATIAAAVSTSADETCADHERRNTAIDPILGSAFGQSRPVCRPTTDYFAPLDIPRPCHADSSGEYARPAGQRNPGDPSSRS